MEIAKSTATDANSIATCVLILVERIKTLDEYLIGSPRTPFDLGRLPFVIVVEHADYERFELDCEAVLTKLWHNYGIANVILIAPFEQSSKVRQIEFY